MRTPRILPRPFEVLTFGVVLAIVVYLRLNHLRIDWGTVEFIGRPLLSRLPFTLALGLALQSIGLLLRRRSPLDWLRASATIESAWLWLRLWLAAMAMTYGYAWLKVCVPLLRSTLIDPQLWALDRALHLGISPSVFASELVRGTPLAGWLDGWYALWVSTVLGALAYVFLDPEHARRRNFALACAALWLSGAWLYLALPALGPCFASPDVFAGVLAEMPHARGGQGALWNNYLRMLAGRDGTLREFNPYLGIAALPSLHVGAHWMFALWARRHEPRLFLPLATATGLTFFGSVASGWHYAIDGYAGMLLGWGAIVLADRLEPVPEAANARAPGSLPAEMVRPPG